MLGPASDRVRGAAGGCTRSDASAGLPDGASGRPGTGDAPRNRSRRAGLSLLAPSTAAAARSEFFGIVQGPTLEQDQDTPGDGRRPGPDEPLPAQLEVGAAEPRAPSAGAPRTGSSAGLPRAESGRSPPCGGTRIGYRRPARPPLDRPQDIQAWQNFLKALVARYGPGGSYWATAYRQQYGASATPLPIQSWQIWNEPNLKKFYVPVPIAPELRPAGADLHGAIRSRIPRPRSCSPECPATGT